MPDGIGSLVTTEADISTAVMFIEMVYEIAFGDFSNGRDITEYSYNDVLDKLREHDNGSE